MKKEDCIFCKLANGDIPTNSIYEDDDFKVILDASPAAKGHALILPKEHFADLFEMDEKTGSALLPLAAKVGAHIKSRLSCDGLNVVQNNGAAAGQSVFHLHVHLIPRFEGDNVIREWNHLTLTDEEQEAIREQLKSELRDCDNNQSQRFKC